MRARFLAAWGAAIWVLGGCCATPVVAAGAGRGFFAQSPQLVLSPPTAWPPAPAPSASCDEIADFELTGVQHTACPSFQSAPVPVIHDADAPIAEGGGDVTCYKADRLIVVVSYVQKFGPHICRHVTGMAVLPGAGK